MTNFIEIFFIVTIFMLAINYLIGPLVMYIFNKAKYLGVDFVSIFFVLAGVGIFIYIFLYKGGL